FAVEESPMMPGVLWAGTDDGLVQISRDNGRRWTNVTPKDMPVDGTVNAIDLSAKSPGRAIVSVYKYMLSDFTPYAFQTDDFGATWKRIADPGSGIPNGHFIRVVREDPDRAGFLVAGTEYGLYASWEGG